MGIVPSRVTKRLCWANFEFGLEVYEATLMRVLLILFAMLGLAFFTYHSMHSLLSDVYFSIYQSIPVTIILRYIAAKQCFGLWLIYSYTNDMQSFANYNLTIGRFQRNYALNLNIC